MVEYGFLIFVLPYFDPAFDVTSLRLWLLVITASSARGNIMSTKDTDCITQLGGIDSRRHCVSDLGYGRVNCCYKDSQNVL